MRVTTHVRTRVSTPGILRAVTLLRLRHSPQVPARGGGRVVQCDC